MGAKRKQTEAAVASPKKRIRKENAKKPATTQEEKKTGGTVEKLVISKKETKQKSKRAAVKKIEKSESSDEVSNDEDNIIPEEKVKESVRKSPRTKKKDAVEEVKQEVKKTREVGGEKEEVDLPVDQKEKQSVSKTRRGRAKPQELPKAEPVEKRITRAAKTDIQEKKKAPGAVGKKKEDQKLTKAPANSSKKVTAISQDKEDDSSKSSVEEKSPRLEKTNQNDIRIISWNVAGIKAWLKKKCLEKFLKDLPDILALQETKCGEVPSELQSALKDYNFYLNPAEKQGYSGVLLLSKQKPLNVWTNPKEVQSEVFREKGRFIILEFENFFFINAYVPNSGRGLTNLAKRVLWNKSFLEEVKKLDAIKPVIIGGDLNVAHQEIDLANPAKNMNKSAGFTDDERNDFTRLLDAGFVDVFRELNPEKKDAYTFWSNMHNSRANNVGWRLDYFVVSEKLFEKVEECEIHSDVMGSDHCPISLKISI